MQHLSALSISKCLFSFLSVFTFFDFKNLSLKGSIKETAEML